ncbi:hypothetical protein [Nitrosomonas communis]|uniref:Uncharacterized protein n=1 Tax=Nitrosomonas communis TaxID=44574 RepID=A0A1I4WVT7_9PROT|nr:hypothetical protein [Nitrosomonas communis]SFN17587.1 hypothetical protein SAMN05421863_11224 [Nitrosomonas communis]
MKLQAGPLSTLMKVALHMMHRTRTAMHLLVRDVMARMTRMRKVVSTRLAP